MPAAAKPHGGALLEGTKQENASHVEQELSKTSALSVADPIRRKLQEGTKNDKNPVAICDWMIFQFACWAETSKQHECIDFRLFPGVCGVCMDVVIHCACE